ncbi:hypothetical protein ACFLV7_04670 [Chloroflexota bacterium]
MLTTRAMVLGSLDPRINYETSLYYSTKAVSINYIPGSLNIEPGGWDLANSEFLGDLFGFEYKKQLPPSYSPPGKPSPVGDQDWDEYLDRIWDGLNGGAAVQICQGWMNVTVTPDGQMIGPAGVDPYWWEGMQNRPDMHYGAVVGMDRRADPQYVCVHDPIGGWLGLGRDIEYTRDEFIERIDACTVPQLQRITHTYYDPTPNPSSKLKNLPLYEIEEQVQERMIGKINGDPLLHDTEETWKLFLGSGWSGFIAYGADDGLDALLIDLVPRRLYAIIDEADRYPLDMVSYLDLGVYHYAHIAGISAEHLEEQGRIDEWEWMFKLHILYERMQLSTARIRSIFKTHYTEQRKDTLQNAIEESQDHLSNLRGTIRKVKNHFYGYPDLMTRLNS